MTGRRIEGRFQPEPFPCAFQRGAIPLIEQRLAEHRRSVVGLIDPPDVVCLDAPGDWPAEMWTNLNHPGDLAEFIRRSGAESQGDS